jgi:hypothetical protein
MGDTTDEHDEDQPLSERFLDLFVFLPTGLAVTLVEELPRLAERGRERLGVQVNSARAVGKFAVHAGGHELKRRSEGLRRTPGPVPSGPTPERRASAAGQGVAGGGTTPPRLRAIPRPPTSGADASTLGTPAARGGVATAPTARQRAEATTGPSTWAPATAPPLQEPPPRPVDGHVPAVASLAIPGFDALSASQVVQRLDGLSRSELVSVRAYETSTRGRRTILSRVDQLLDERS